MAARDTRRRELTRIAREVNVFLHDINIQAMGKDGCWVYFARSRGVKPLIFIDFGLILTTLLPFGVCDITNSIVTNFLS